MVGMRQQNKWPSYIDKYLAVTHDRDLAELSCVVCCHNIKEEDSGAETGTSWTACAMLQPSGSGRESIDAEQRREKLRKQSANPLVRRCESMALARRDWK